MIRYSVKKNGIETNAWFSDSGRDETYYEPSFGLPERWVPHADDINVVDILEEREVELWPARTLEIEPAVEAKEELLDSYGNVLEPAVEAKAAVIKEIPAITRKEVKLRAQYTIEIVDITDEIEQQKINEEALAYLASTDWLVIRQMDSGTPMPEDIKAKRAEARAKIKR